MKRAVIYLRVSTDRQAREGYSLAAQRKMLDEYAVAHDYEIVHVYEDAGKSGKDILHRPEMVQLLADARAGKFDTVLVVWFSRLTRNVGDTYALMQIFDRLGVDFISLTEPFDTTTAIGRFSVCVLGAVAQYERELTGERVLACMTERARQGKRTCNDVLGYDLSGPDNLVINPREAKIVRYIDRTYLRYRNLSFVAEACRKKGYVGKRGRPFTPEGIRKILTRPIYCGYNSYNGQLYKGSHPPIRTVSTHNKIQRLLSENVAGRKLQSSYRLISKDNA